MSSRPMPTYHLANHDADKSIPGAGPCSAASLFESAEAEDSAGPDKERQRRQP
ncbi:hypothetical protein [Sporisorium scitamineum]|uniref:Uncharacterized protein n=1 Tax=Sporisorium scitamineum TaxID=49012 RepID=A0A0F7S3M6_9BASI|nr:hypothetical protein [Sporisorium scitamineum]